MAITDEHLHKLSLFDWHLEHGADYQKYALYGLGAGALASCFYGKESDKRTLKHAAKFGAVGAGVGIAAVFLLFKAGELISDKSHEIVRAGYRTGNEAALGYGMDPVGAFRAGVRRGWGHGGGGGGWGHGGGGWGHGGHGWGHHGHHGWGGGGGGGGGGEGGGEGGDDEGGFGPEEPIHHPHEGWHHHPEHHHHGWRR